MARVETKAEISPATAALVFFLVLAVAGISLWYFVIQQPLPTFNPPAISPSAADQPRPAEKTPAARNGSESKTTQRGADSGVRVTE